MSIDIWNEAIGNGSAINGDSIGHAIGIEPNWILILALASFALSLFCYKIYRAKKEKK